MEEAPCSLGLQEKEIPPQIRLDAYFMYSK